MGLNQQESPAEVVRRQYLASAAGDLEALRGTGKPLAVRVAHHFVVRGGLIVRFEQFVDTALVRDAASAA